MPSGDPGACLCRQESRLASEYHEQLAQRLNRNDQLGRVNVAQRAQCRKLAAFAIDALGVRQNVGVERDGHA